MSYDQKIITYYPDSPLGQWVEHCTAKWDERKIIERSMVRHGDEYLNSERRLKVEAVVRREAYEKAVEEGLVVIDLVIDWRLINFRFDETPTQMREITPEVEVTRYDTVACVARGIALPKPESSIIDAEKVHR